MRSLLLQVSQGMGDLGSEVRQSDSPLNREPWQCSASQTNDETSMSPSYS